MPPTFRQLLTTIAAYPAAVNKAISLATEPEDLVDLAATMAHVRAEAWGKQRAIQSEIQDGEAGHDYVAKVAGTNERTYNTDRLMLKVMNALDVDFPTALRYLIANKVIDFNWRWTQLQAEARILNLELTIAKQAIDDGDGTADVGEVWRPTTTTYQTKEAHADTT